MSEQPQRSASPELMTALTSATFDDVEFVEEAISSHPDIKETKIGCRPIAVCGVPLPDPNLVVYVRTTAVDGNYWYVLDWSRPNPEGLPKQLLVGSEAEAREAVIAGLKRAYGGEGG